MHWYNTPEMYPINIIGQISNKNVCTRLIIAMFLTMKNYNHVKHSLLRNANFCFTQIMGNVNQIRWSLGWGDSNDLEVYINQSKPKSE